MLKTKTKVKIGFVSLLSIAAGVQASSIVAQQVNADPCEARGTSTSPAKCNVTFQVNVVESLSVSLTTPQESASGGIGTFLRNAVNLEVASNNSNGFTASMYSDGSTTNLTNQTSGKAETLPTLASNTTRSAFPSNYWGYSLGSYSKVNSSDTSETSAGLGTSVYKPLVSTSATPITILKSTAASTDNQDIYFGTKADANQASGTYTGTVLFSVVTGNITDDNPVTPTNPADPSVKPTTNTNNGDNNSYYTSTSGYAGSANGATVQNTTTSDNTAGTTTTTTNVQERDTRNSYANPAGVIENTTSSINSGAPLATGLAVTAGVAAASGIFFFILAKRKKDDEDEEEEDQA